MVPFDNTAQSWAADFLISIGVTLVAPVILPVITAGIRPLAKLIIKGGFFVADTVGTITVGIGTEMSQLIAEARAELDTAAEKRAVSVVEEITGDEVLTELAEAAVEIL